MNQIPQEDFGVKMIKAVDQSKCIGCGTCQRVCPLDVFRLEVNQPQASPCTAACPVHNDMRKINYLLEMGKVHEAAGLMMENNPLASVTGRICPRLCELECTRKEVDRAVNIGAIEQYLGDYALEEEVERAPRRHVAQVAVVGSGPAGLSCAYFLAADGFRVTVFDVREEPGGMLRYGIPEDRLPRPIITALIERLQKMGVIMKCGQALNEDFTLKDLQDQGFGAVFLGLGAAKGEKINGDEDSGMLAAGQSPPPSTRRREPTLKLTGELMGPDNRVKVEPDTHQTSLPNVFAAGDVVTGPASVAQAVGGGKRAAHAIMLSSRGIDLSGLPPRELAVTQKLPENARLRVSMRHERKSVDEKGGNGFSGLPKGFDLLETLAEAERCLTCGAKSRVAHPDDCMTCFACEIDCPVGAIFVHPFKEILPRSLRPV